MNIAIVNCQRIIPVPISKIRFAARKALRKLQREYDQELSIVFVGPQRMRRMNKKYLGHDYVTDVITFDYGEIIVCPGQAARNAKRYGNTVEGELVLYVIHGILHLAGYEDKTPDGLRRMRAKERELM